MPRNAKECFSWLHLKHLNNRSVKQAGKMIKHCLLRYILKFKSFANSQQPCLWNQLCCAENMKRQTVAVIHTTGEENDDLWDRQSTEVARASPCPRGQIHPGQEWNAHHTIHWPLRPSWSLTVCMLLFARNFLFICTSNSSSTQNCQIKFHLWLMERSG